tara:strand:- start:431 stop:1891 length:1461 start_codon:yes stop_codon:yes gene_type:complete
MSEIIDISSLGGGSESLNIESGGGLSSSNFGPGIELLMNDKKPITSNNNSSSIDIDDITNLEAELNDAVDVGSGNISDSFLNIGEGIESIKLGDDIFGKTDDDTPLNVKFDSPEPIKIGSHTSQTNVADSKTWDGYGKFNDIPIDPEVNMPSTKSMSKEEMMREKFSYLKKLEVLEKKGAELTKKYTMDSSLQEMMGEYEMLISEKEKENSIKFQGNMLSAAINGIEFLNNRFDPFDIKLDGWGEQFGENVNDYDEIFAELHEKYKSKAKMAPELKLMFQLAGSAMMIHMTNTMFKSQLPNMDDMMRQNPELMQQFSRAAADSIGKTSPGLSGFMNNVMSSSDPTPINTGPPPTPMETQGPMSMPPPNRPGFVEKRAFASNRPDIESIRGNSVEDNFQKLGEDMEEKILKKRPEMKTPTTNTKNDVNNILSNLKTKTVDMDSGNNDDSGSTISISELKEMQLGDAKIAKRTKKRKGSEKNIISLEL